MKFFTVTSIRSKRGPILPAKTWTFDSSLNESSSSNIIESLLDKDSLSSSSVSLFEVDSLLFSSVLLFEEDSLS